MRSGVNYRKTKADENIRNFLNENIMFEVDNINIGVDRHKPMHGLGKYHPEWKVVKDKPSVDMLCADGTAILFKEPDLIVQPQGDKSTATADASNSSLHKRTNGSVEHQTTNDKELLQFLETLIGKNDSSYISFFFPVN